MSAVHGRDHGDEWDDEDQEAEAWADWSHLDVVSRAERPDHSLLQAAGRIVAIGLLLPLVLVVLVALLIWLF